MRSVLFKVSFLTFVVAFFSINLFSQASQNDKWTKFLKQNSKEIKSLESENFDDLKFLKKLLKEKRIVQLGEGGHGMKEYFQAKTRLVKFLHQEMDFEVIAFESSLYQCYQSDKFAGDLNPMKSLIDCMFGVWHTKEVLNLFEYIKKNRQTDKPLKYIGFDIQPIGRNKKHRPKFLKEAVAKIDKKSAQEIFELDEFFLKEYAKKSNERRKSFRENRSKFIESYEKTAKLIKENLAKYKHKKDALVAMQTANFLAQYIKQQTALDLKAYVELRDEGMAQNIEFIAENLYPNKKIIIWGHNAHIRYKNEDIPPTKEIFPGVATRMMGSWLMKKYVGKIYTIGFYTNSGSATNNRRKVYQITDAKGGMFESKFKQLSGNYLFVDFLNQRKKRGKTWMFTIPVTARYNGIFPQEMVITNQYDGVIFIKEVSPPEYLY